MKRFMLAASAALLIGAGACQPNNQPISMSGRWEVQEIAGASLGESVDIWMVIDADAGSISGFTGCNNFTASLDSFGEALTVGAIAEEPGDCPNQATATDEARFLMVLPQVQRRIQRGASLQLLHAAPGSETLIKLRRDEPLGG